MGKSVKYEYDANKKQIVVLFKNGFRVEDESSFCRTHYFADTDNRIITTMFKDQLLKLFNVDSVKELKDKIDNNIKLLFKPGEGEIEFDDNTKTVIVYTTTFKEEVVKPAEKTKKLKKNIEKLSNNEKISSYEYTNLITTIAEGIDAVELNEKDRNTIARIIPKLIKDGNVKPTRCIVDGGFGITYNEDNGHFDLRINEKNKLPLKLCQERPIRPRPFVWRFASIT